MADFKFIYPGIGIPVGRDAGRAGAGEEGERGGAGGAGEEGGGAERGDETGDGQNQGDLQGKQNLSGHFMHPTGNTRKCTAVSGWNLCTDTYKMTSYV